MLSALSPCTYVIRLIHIEKYAVFCVLRKLLLWRTKKSLGSSISLQQDQFSHTPEEAMSGGLAKACVTSKN